jgi:hypothetical protein
LQNQIAPLNGTCPAHIRVTQRQEENMTMSFDTKEQYTRVEDEFVATAEPDDETEEELEEEIEEIEEED